MQIRTCAGDKIMMSLVEFEPHAVVEEHSHPHEQTGMMLAGKAVFNIGGVEKTLGPGDFYLIPGNVRHKVYALDEPVACWMCFIRCGRSIARVVQQTPGEPGTSVTGVRKCW